MEELVKVAPEGAGWQEKAARLPRWVCRRQDGGDGF